MSYRTVAICLPLVAHRWNCHTSKFKSRCAYRSGEIRFYGYLAVASASLGLPPQFVHCCLITARAFMPASLIAIPYTILEISTFLGQLPVDDDDDDDDDENCQLNASIASLRSELCIT